MIETIFTNRDTDIAVKVFEDGIVLPLEQVTRMTLQLGSVIIDSDVAPALIDWQSRYGTVKFAFPPDLFEPGLHQATLIAFDALHPAGQAIAHPAGPKLTFRVVR